MSLTNKDLAEISKVIQIELKHNNARLKEVFVTKEEFSELKQDVNKLKDDIASINSKLDNDFLIRGKEIIKIKRHLSLE